MRIDGWQKCWGQFPTIPILSILGSLPNEDSVIFLLASKDLYLVELHSGPFEAQIERNLGSLGDTSATSLLHIFEWLSLL